MKTISNLAKYPDNLFNQIQELKTRLAALERQAYGAATDGNINGNLVVQGTATINGTTSLIDDTTIGADLVVTDGLRVGDSAAPTNDDIRAVATIAAGGGLYAGNVAGEPGTGIVVATDDVRTGGGLVVGSSTQNAATGYAYISNGLRVGDLTTPTNDDIRATADIAAGGGLYAGNVAGEPTNGYIHYTGELICNKNSVNSSVYGYHQITEAEGILIPWDGSGAGLSDISADLIDVSAEFTQAGHVFPRATAGIKSYVLNWAIRDSASAGNSTYVQLSPTISNTYSTAFGSEGRTNDKFDRGQVHILCNSAGDFYMWREATGSGTMDLYISIVGYYI